MPSDNREWKQSGAGERVNRSISVVASSSILVPGKGKAPPFGKVVSVSFLLDTSSELLFENSFVNVLSSTTQVMSRELGFESVSMFVEFMLFMSTLPTLDNIEPAAGLPASWMGTLPSWGSTRAHSLTPQAQVAVVVIWSGSSGWARPPGQ